METNYNRRNFLKLSAGTFGTLVLAGAGFSQDSATGKKALRIGFVGVGDRGSYHLDAALGIDGVVVPAICDINTANLYRAKKWVEEAGQPTPGLYGKTRTDFERMCAEEDLDVVICCTSWKWHAPVCLSAMKNGKHAVSEVPIIQTLEEAWELVETSEKTGKWATLGLEQALIESSYGLSLLNMVRQRVLGDVVHCEGGYVHDLRLVKFDPEREPWRLQHSIERNGNLYPDHPMNKIMPLMDINHGDRFDYLVSMSSKAGMLNKYADLFYGEKSPYAKVKMAQGDYNASLIRTAGGKMVTLNFDTNTPHPRELFRVQGTQGIFLTGNGIGSKIYIDGQSPAEHQWEEAGKYLEKFKHPLVKNYNPPPRKSIRGHGGGKKGTPLTWHLLIQALRQGKSPYFDVYDSVTSSAVSPLSEMSVSGRSKAVDFPDFTRGKWKERKPIKFT